MVRVQLADIRDSKPKLMINTWQRGNIISISRIREPFGVAPRRPLGEDNQRAKEVRKIPNMMVPNWDKIYRKEVKKNDT